MTFVDMEITRLAFAACYVNFGRARLRTLADMYGVDIDVAENWADAIDREAEPSTLPHSAAFGSHGAAGAAANLSMVAAPAQHSGVTA